MYYTTRPDNPLKKDVVTDCDSLQAFEDYLNDFEEGQGLYDPKKMLITLGGGKEGNDGVQQALNQHNDQQ